jgi:hypothetical protein
MEEISRFNEEQMRSFSRLVYCWRFSWHEVCFFIMPCLLFIANTHTSNLACSSETDMFYDSSNLKLGKQEPR